MKLTKQQIETVLFDFSQLMGWKLDFAAPSHRAAIDKTIEKLRLEKSPKFITMLERKPRSGKRVAYLAKRMDEPVAAGLEIVAPQGVLYESYAVYTHLSEAVSRATELNIGEKESSK